MNYTLRVYEICPAGHMKVQLALHTKYRLAAVRMRGCATPRKDMQSHY